MPEDESFRDFICDQLRGLGNVTARAMFGGYGLYCDTAFFGILDDDRLYFKTDKLTQKEYEKLGSKPFTYLRKDPATGRKKKASLHSYFEVPVDILEDGDQLVSWARKAVRAQRAE